MSLLQMSFYGAVLTIVVMVIRVLAVNRLPKRTFIVLWGIVLIRLLIPFEIPSEFSVYSLVGYGAGSIPVAEQAESGIMQRILQGFQKSENQLNGMTESGQAEIINGEMSITRAAVSDVDLSAQLAGKLDDRVSAQLSEKLNDGASAQSSGKLSDGVSAQLLGMPDDGVSAQLSGKLNDEVSIQSSGISNAEGLVQPSEIPGNDADMLESRKAGGSIFAKLTNKVNRISSLTWMIIWGVGAALCMIFFAITYLRCRIEFGMSLPVQNEFVEQWLEERHMTQGRNGLASWRKRLTLHWFRRHITARVSDGIDTPLTYGVTHPVILLPKKTEWEETEQLEYVLWHEYMHIRHGDNVLKIIAVAALCIHWFNPFVWAMYFLLNRDIELACDESVIRRYGIGYRSSYANMLISMEAKRSGLMPLCNNFSQNAIEERVRAIMKVKKISIGAVIFAVGLVVGVTTAFATSAAGDMGKESNHYENTEWPTDQQLTGMSHEGIEEKNVGDNNSTGLTEIVNANGSANTAVNQAERMDIFNAEFTPEEYERLRALQFDGYEDMTVSEFQNKVWTLYDTVEYRELLNRFSELSDRLPMNETFYENQDDIDGTICYLSNVLEPLTAEQWRKRDFSGYVSAGMSNPPENVIQDMAVLEYVMTLTILDADRLTVREYIFARSGMEEAIEDNIFSPYYSAGELADQELMQVVISDTMTALTAEFSTDELQVNVEWVYKPLDALETYMDEVYVNEEHQKERLEQWETVLKPYMPFGLTWDYDARNDEFKMYFRGREVRGIVDEERDVWIAEHAGIGENVYAEDAIELYAVYENGQLTGLRAATEEEQEEWTLRRRQTTDGYRGYS